MADVDNERTEGPQGRAKPTAAPLRTVKRNGSVATIAAAAVAVAAIVVCVVLFMQVGALKKQLQASGVDVPAGLTAENGEVGAHGEPGGEAVDQYAWQDNPMEVVYELGEFQFNTADGKHGMMDIALVLESGWTTEERQHYEMLKEFHDAEVANYLELMREYNEGKMGRLEAPGTDPLLAAARREPRLLRSGVVLAQHGAPKETGPPPEPDPPPDEPQTILEKVLNERRAQVRDTVLGLVSSHSSAELITAAGKDVFKQELMDELNSFIEDYYGRIIDVYLTDIVTT